MHLSNDLQKQLDNLDSGIKLAKTIDGELPANYSFLGGEGRQFRTEFASSQKDYSIVFYERTDRFVYENCFGRALFNNLNKLARAIDLWVNKQYEISDIKKVFDEIELYQDFEFKNLNPDIEESWTKVKNMFFNDTDFWKQNDWNNRYLEMLNEAKQRIEFNNYYPFTSHYWLRFSLDKDLRETWILDIYVTPTYETSKSRFYVSFSEEPMGGVYFETAKQAIDFYAEKLNEIKPIRWDLK